MVLWFAWVVPTGLTFRPHTLQALAIAAYLETHPATITIAERVKGSLFNVFEEVLVSTRDGIEDWCPEFRSYTALALVTTFDLAQYPWDEFTRVRVMCPCQSSEPIHKCSRRHFNERPRVYFGHRTDCLREY